MYVADVNIEVLWNRKWRRYKASLKKLSWDVKLDLIGWASEVLLWLRRLERWLEANVFVRYSQVAGLLQWYCGWPLQAGEEFRWEFDEIDLLWRTHEMKHPPRRKGGRVLWDRKWRRYKASLNRLSQWSTSLAQKVRVLAGGQRICRGIPSPR